MLTAARPGDAHARLVVLGGPPGVGKSSVADALLRLLPNSACVDKDWCAGGFVLEAARLQGRDPGVAYSGDTYWQRLRPLEYGGAVTAACAQLLGRRTVLLTGGWGPELALDDLWPRLAAAIAPAGLRVLHLDAPARELWRRRLAARGSRADEPWFGAFADAVTSHAVWPGATRIGTDGALHEVVQAAVAALEAPPPTPRTGSRS